MCLCRGQVGGRLKVGNLHSEVGRCVSHVGMGVEFFKIMGCKGGSVQLIRSIELGTAWPVRLYVHTEFVGPRLDKRGGLATVK